MILDDFDRQILTIVQANNQRTHASIGEEIGLSGSAVRKRLAALRSSGIIAADVALLRDNPSLVRVVVTVTFKEVTSEVYATFEDLVLETPEILQAYHVAGGEDYILIMSCPNLAWYEAWSIENLVSNPVIGFFETKVVWSRKKFVTAVPL